MTHFPAKILNALRFPLPGALRIAECGRRVPSLNFGEPVDCPECRERLVERIKDLEGSMNSPGMGRNHKRIWRMRINEYQRALGEDK